MERNDKNSRRLDEQRQHEVQGLVQGAPVSSREDFKEQEGIGPLEPGRRPETAEAVGDQPSIDEATVRAEFIRWLRPGDLPTTAPDLAAAAREDSAPDWVVQALETLDSRVWFHTTVEVYDAVAPVHPSEDD